MRRVLLDTNIYGEMILDKDLEELKEDIRKKIIVYGSDVIRKEIRNAPRWTSRYPKNMNDAYRKLGGNMPKIAIINDLLIVACASIKELDVVASNDKKTMMNSKFRNVYTLVNDIIEKKSPSFVDYSEFKVILRRSPL